MARYIIARNVSGHPVFLDSSGTWTPDYRNARSYRLKRDATRNATRDSFAISVARVNRHFVMESAREIVRTQNDPMGPLCDMSEDAIRILRAHYLDSSNPATIELLKDALVYLVIG